MRNWLIALPIAFGALAAGPVQAAVRVTFADPAGYRDVDRAGGVQRPDDTLAQIAGYLQRLGHRLPAGQDLDIQILDVNLAGVSAQDLGGLQTSRILNVASWPSIRLRYTLRQNGRVVRTAEELVADREYLSRANIQFAEDPLRFEKNMLQDWFDARFRLGWKPPA